MTGTAELTQAAASGDPAVGLRAVRALHELADRLEAQHVAAARRNGWSWQEVAGPLGVSRQAAHKKHGRGLLGRSG